MSVVMSLKALLFREGSKISRSLIGIATVNSRSLCTMPSDNGVGKRTGSGDPELCLNGKKTILPKDITLSEKYSICIEGNIGCGKTTLLEYYDQFDNTEVFLEPVKKWRDVKGHNVLDLMYRDPTRWGMTFQTYVQLTMLDMHTLRRRKPIKMMERSIYSAKYCFVENLHRCGKMPDVDYVVLTEWFDWIIKSQDVKVDLMVYLRTDPKTVYERIQRRYRKEEEGIPLEYLQTLHDLHEEWLVKKKFPCPFEVLILDGNPGIEDMLKIYEENKSKILQGVS